MQAPEREAVFNEGFDKGYNTGFDKGFRDGKHAGGDDIVDRILPGYQILPDVRIEDIIAAGVEQYRSHIYHMMTAEQVGDQIMEALDGHIPFSLVRLGDGELLTMAQETVLSVEQVKREGIFLPYAGVHVPDLKVREELVNAIRGAAIIGIPKLRQPNFLPLAMSVFRAYGIDYRSLNITDSLVNYYLYQAGYLSRVTQGRRVLVVGNKAPQLAAVLRQHGVQVVGEVNPVEGVKDVPRVKEEIARYSFDIALISAGISAVLISEWISSNLGKVALDFGHLADSIVKGDAPFR
jgi:hypothetical protein